MRRRRVGAHDGRMFTEPRPAPAALLSHPSPAAVVEVGGLVKRYGDIPVVNDVSFQVREGEIFGLLGANGAGKTTTVECLQGLRRPDAGHLRVLGLDPVHDRSRLRQVIGSQLQDAALPDRLRVGEAVRLFDRSSRGDAVTHLEAWGLGDRRTTAFADLSGGQRQRLFIVLALLNEPRVVFLDELTQGLDPAARRDVWRVIRRIRDGGTTVVLVSHFADEIEALCDRVAVMGTGRIVDTGTPRQLTDRHARTATITFTPPPSFEPDTLRRLGDVSQVERHGEHFVVRGSSTMIAPVCARLLDDAGHGPPDLRVQHPSLDDALIGLIGVAP
ncbi:ABC transporter ATP-binding protein [soil metagenome]